MQCTTGTTNLNNSARSTSIRTDNVVQYNTNADNIIESISVNDQVIPVSMYFCGNSPTILPNLLDALKQASITFDGRIVVNHDFETNDPKMQVFVPNQTKNRMSAGPLVKFKSSEGIKQNLTRFSQRELGHKVRISQLLISVGYFVAKFTQNGQFRRFWA